MAGFELHHLPPMTKEEIESLVRTGMTHTPDCYKKRLAEGNRVCICGRTSAVEKVKDRLARIH